MRLYETAFLIAPNLPEEDVEQLVSEMAEIVSDKKGTMKNIDKWGKRRMAYSIREFNEAYYVFFHYDGEPAVPAELERRFKQTENVIRYLTLKKDTKENIRKKKKKRGQQKRTMAPPPKREPKKPNEPVEAEKPESAEQPGKEM